MPDANERRRKRNKRTVIALKYPKHWFNPEDLMNFTEFPPFVRRWEKLGLNDEEDLCSLQMFIAVDPKAAPVIPGTMGIRKGRYSPAGWNIGKSGALRVLYKYFEEFGFVALLLVYPKSEVDDISEDVKKALNRMAMEAERELRRQFSLDEGQTRQVEG